MAAAFLSAYFVSIVSVAYVGAAYEAKGRPASVPMAYIAVLLPLAYGFFGVLNKAAVARFGNNASLGVGAIFGLLLSLLGRFALNLPRTIFGMTSATEHAVHLHAALLYAFIFRFLVTPLTAHLSAKQSKQSKQ